MNKIKIILIVVISIITISIISFIIYTSIYYKANFNVDEILNNNVEIHEDYYILNTSEKSESIYLFYPGGKVEAVAYLPLLDKLRNEGITCILFEMPFNLAVFGSDKASKVSELCREYENVYIGGHSLGGAMASSYAEENKDIIDGVILLGSYMYSDYDLSKSVTIYGSLDTILSKPEYTQGVKIIEGGNHSGFGNYGFQKGDTKAEITIEEQQKLTVEYILEFIKKDINK